MPVYHVKKTTNYTVMSNHHLRNREQIDAIRQAVHELEQAGYIVRAREQDSRGRLRGAEVHHL